MKCRECGNCYKGFWASAPEAYVCIAAKEPFEIVDVNSECVRHGHWEISFDGYYPYCSECGKKPYSGKREECCPICGAIMDGDKDA